MRSDLDVVSVGGIGMGNVIGLIVGLRAVST